MNFIAAFLQKFPTTLLIVLAAISVVIGDFFAKYWSLHSRNVFYVLAIIFYIGSAVFYMPSLLKEGLVITVITWTLLATIGFLFVGILIFKESLSLIQTAGLTLGIVSLIMLSFGK